MSSEYAETVPDVESVDNAEVPEVADDDSPERANVPEPQEPALPGDGYTGVESTGTTVGEQLAGESLDTKLARETED